MSMSLFPCVFTFIILILLSSGCCDEDISPCKGQTKEILILILILSNQGI